VKMISSSSREKSKNLSIFDRGKRNVHFRVLIRCHQDNLAGAGHGRKSPEGLPPKNLRTHKPKREGGNLPFKIRRNQASKKNQHSEGMEARNLQPDPYNRLAWTGPVPRVEKRRMRFSKPGKEDVPLTKGEGSCRACQQSGTQKKTCNCSALIRQDDGGVL